MKFLSLPGALLAITSALTPSSRADDLTASLTSSLFFGQSTTQSQPTSNDGPAYFAGFSASWWPGVPVTSNDFPTSITFGPADSPVTVAIDSSTSNAIQPSTAPYSGYTVAILNGSFGGVSIDLYYKPTAPIPAGTSFSATLHGNAFDGITSSAVYDPTNLPEIPLFSPESYNVLTSGTYSGTESVSFSALSVPAGATDPSRTFLIYNTTNAADVPVSQQVTDPSITSFALDTNLLGAGNIYSVSIDDQYFVGGIGYRSSVKFEFSAVPEPSVGALASGAGALLISLGFRHRKRRT